MTQVEKVERFIAQAGRRQVLVLGPADTGKSWLVDVLAERPSGRRAAVAVIDADPGQSRIGPPAAIGLQQPRRPDADADALSFVGAISPSGHLLPMLCGVVRMAEQAKRRGAELIVIDAPGFVDGPAAEALWRGVIDVLHPAVVLVSREDRGCGGWLAGVAPTLELTAHEEVVLRGSAQRRAYRAAAWERYFGAAPERVVNTDRVTVWQMGGARGPLVAGQVVSLRDAQGADMALGIVSGDFAGEVRVSAPVIGEQRTASLVGGRLRLDRTTWREEPL